MKKVLLFILFMGFLFCITGCGEEDPMDDPFVQELEEYSFKDHLQCTKSEEKISYKIDVFQDPETYEVVFGALTETYDIYPYDNQGNFTGFDPEKEYCSDYEKDTFSKCKADMFNVGEGEKYNRGRARYYYKKDVLNPNEEFDKEALDNLKEITEEDGYFCEIFR